MKCEIIYNVVLYSPFFLKVLEVGPYNTQIQALTVCLLLLCGERETRPRIETLRGCHEMQSLVGREEVERG